MVGKAFTLGDMIMKLLFVALLGLSLSAHADYKSFYFQKTQEKKSSNLWSSVKKPKTEVSSFQQKLNHQDLNDSRTFTQRYFINTQYASSPSAPTLFYLCGEATCQGPSGALFYFAEKLKANLISLEHRYYGKSQPFAQLSTENLKYLSTENALQDAALFQKFAMNQLGFNGKWIVVGGSYAGSLAAYYREKFPQLVAGALASSGPVQADDNFEEYDKHVASVAGPECLSQIHKVVAQLESALQKPEELTRLKATFSAEKLLTDLDFVYLIADMGALAIQYGYKDRFCQLLNSEDPMKGYAQFTQEIYKSWGMTALSGSASGAVSLNPDDYENDFGMRQWFYQSCTEYGYWQNAYHDKNLSARSQLINEEYHRDICRRLFNINFTTPTQKINEMFYSPLLLSSTSQIFFTNGSTDPWINLSIAKENGNTVNSKTSHITIAGAAHCDDLRSPKTSDSSSLQAARAQFLELATEWLK